MTVDINNITLSYENNQGQDELILKDLSLKFEEGEFVCLVGPSGCGKSTLLGLIAGFVKPDQGEIIVSGKKVTRPDLNRTLVFQEYALFPWLNVIDNVCFGLKKLIKDKQERYLLAARYLKLVGLLDYARSSVGELSGGMKQRVALARALVVKPDLLLMDEPFAALDSHSREVMQVELIRIWKELNSEIRSGSKQSVVFVTHSVDEALLLADRIIVMSKNERDKNNTSLATIPSASVKADIKISDTRPRDLSSENLKNFKNLILEGFAKPSKEERYIYEASR